MKKLGKFKTEAINNFIPDAVMVANQKIGKVSAHSITHWSDQNKIDWNITYHGEMDRLTKKVGLRV